VKHLVALLLSAAISFASMQAPNAHVHEHERTSSHTGALFHSHFKHFSHNPPGKLGLSGLSPDDDAVFASWFCSHSATALPECAALPVVFAVPEPRTVMVWRAMAFSPRANGPPFQRTHAARPPPSNLA
jgi:hypothetical protein